MLRAFAPLLSHQPEKDAGTDQYDFQSDFDDDLLR
jgi:hypothetical protein